MANERMDQKPAGVAYLDDIIISANAATGQMAKVTIAQILAANTNRPGGGGGGGGATPLSTPTLTASVISSTQINLSWTNVANESSYKLEWSANGTSGWTQIGGTIAANTTTFNHTGLTPGTIYYYRVSAIGDGVTYSNSGYGTANATTSGAVTEEDLVLSTAHGLSVSGTTWTGANASTGGWQDNWGIATKKIASGTDGYFQFRLTATDSFPAMGIQSANSNTKYNDGTDGWDFGVFCYNLGTPNIDSYEGGLTTRGTYTIGDYIRIERTGSVWKIRKSPDGSSWTDVYTFSSTYTGDAWVVMSPRDNSATPKIYLPKGYNVV